MLDRTVKRPEKIRKLIEKLGEDKYHWAWEVQHRQFPFWNEAFDYAYELGLKRGKEQCVSGRVIGHMRTLWMWLCRSIKPNTKTINDPS